MEGILVRLVALGMLGLSLAVLWKRKDPEVKTRWTAIRPALPWLSGWAGLCALNTILSVSLGADSIKDAGGIWGLHQGAGLFILGALWGLLRGQRKPSAAVHAQAEKDK